MTCPDLAQLQRLLDGLLHDDDFQPIESHIESCGDCQASLQRLLRSDAVPSEASDPFATTADAGSEATTPAAPSSSQRYRIKQLHDRGGIGEVFVAEDPELNREVALKRMQARYQYDRESRRRFLQEAEITGRLEHPGVVPVYGMDRDESGQPGYAMRFIRGETLHAAIKRFYAAEKPGRDPGERSLALRELLGRFVAVCNTVAYAHSRGIVHRDLKPGNVMLDKYAQTLVVDWGLAKPIERDEAARAGDEKTLTPATAGDDTSTQTGQAMGTPSYMSPEQAAGNSARITAASDIYSLGAILYTVLAGQPPLADGDARDRLERVRRGEIPPPRDVNKSCLPALDAVCRKAMALRPEHRYPTALILAAEVEHWLADEPVSAWPEPWTQRARRWVRRNRTLATASAASLVAVSIVLIAGGLWYQEEQNRRATEEAVRRARAEEALRQALSDAEKARSKLRARLAEKGGVFVLLNHPEGWHAQIQAAQASLETARVLADTGDAIDDTLVQRAAELQDQLAKDDEERRLAVRLDEVRSQRATMNGENFDFASAERNYAEAFRTANANVDQDAAALARRFASSSIREQIVAALDDWAWTVFALDDQRVTHRIERLLDIARRTDPDPAWGDRLRQPAVWRDPKKLQEVVQDAPADRLSPQLLTLIGNLLAKNDPGRESWWRRAQGLYPADFWLNFGTAHALGRRNPDSVGFLRAAIAIRPNNSGAYNNLGIALHHQKKPAEAIAAFDRAIALNPRHAGPHNNRGLVLRDQKRFAEAIAEFQRALAINPDNVGTHDNLGNAWRDQGKVDEAIAEYRKEMTLHPRYASTYNNYGLVLAEQKRYPEAIAAYQTAIGLDPRFGKAWSNLGNCYQEQERNADALAACRKAVAFDPAHATHFINLGVALYATHQLAEAIAALRKAIEVDATSGLAFYNLGLIYLNQKNLPEAVAALRKATTLEPKRARYHYNLGNALRLDGKLAAAAAAYRKAIACDPKSVNAYGNLGAVLTDLGQVAEAADILRVAVAIAPTQSNSWTNLGKALEAQKQAPQALEAFRKAAEVGPRDAIAHSNLGSAWLDRNEPEKAAAACRRAIEIDPQYAPAHDNLGVALVRMNRLADGAAAHQQAIKLDPTSAVAHMNLGHCLWLMGKHAEAIVACQKAIALNPRLDGAYTNLSNSLRAQRRWNEAIAACHKAIKLNPKNATAHNNLSVSLYDQKKLTEALQACRRSIALDPNFQPAYLNLGLILRDMKQFQGALAAYQKAIDMTPMSHRPRGLMAIVLLRRGDFSEAIRVTEYALKLAPPGHPHHDILQKQLERCRGLLQMDQRLARVLDRRDDATPDELVQLAEFCRAYKDQPATAVRLYQDAFKAHPALADDDAKQHRYRAACLALLASGSAGENVVAHRRQALAWLQADLDRFSKGAKAGAAESLLQAELRLSSWQSDANLASVRDAHRVAALPDAERASWQKLWADAAALLKEARSQGTHTVFTGALTEKQRSRAHAWNLVKGRAYRIDLESEAFDAFLKLQDPQGKLVAENDDIDPGVNLNARLLFIAPADGVYRITATAFEDERVGTYTLRIREFRAGK